MINSNTNSLKIEKDKILKLLNQKIPWLSVLSEKSLFRFKELINSVEMGQKKVIKNKGEKLENVIYIIHGKLLKMSKRNSLKDPTNENKTIPQEENLEVFGDNEIIGLYEIFEDNTTVVHNQRYRVSNDCLLVTHPDHPENQIVTINIKELKNCLSERIQNFIIKEINCAPPLKFINFHKLTFVRMLGKGAFGKVYLVRYNNKSYAMKIIPHSNLLNSHIAQFYFKEEISNLHSINSPFVSRFKGYYYDLHYCYILLSFSSGVSLHAAKSSLSIDINPTNVIFYLINILIGLEAIHQKNIIHRDIKTENLVLNSTGYLEIIDFGLSKKIKGFTSTIVGSPYFMSPEVIKGKGYGISADYWSSGITIYELLYGKTPFSSEFDHNVIAIYEKILNKDIFIPQMQNFESDSKYKTLKGIIEGLLEKEVKQRLSLTKIKERLKDNWNDIKDMTYKAPKCNKQVFENENFLTERLTSPVTYQDICTEAVSKNKKKRNKGSNQTVGNNLFNKWLEDNKHLY